jgi:hypothetical protein
LCLVLLYSALIIAGREAPVLWRAHPRKLAFSPKHFHNVMK